MHVINQNIMHLLNTDKTTMTGNGGWSYTLNSLNAVPTNEIHIKPYNAGFKDSVVFEGRKIHLPVELNRSWRADQDLNAIRKNGCPQHLVLIKKAGLKEKGNGS